jgi:hypothetical protein
VIEEMPRYVTPKMAAPEMMAMAGFLFTNLLIDWRGRRRPSPVGVSASSSSSSEGGSSPGGGSLEASTGNPFAAAAERVACV